MTVSECIGCIKGINCELDDFCASETCEEFFPDKDIHERAIAYEDECTQDQDPNNEEISWCKHATVDNQILCCADHKTYNTCFHSREIFPSNKCEWQWREKEEQNYNDFLARADAVKEFEPTEETDLNILVQKAQLELFQAQKTLAEEALTLTHTMKEFLNIQADVLQELMQILRKAKNE